MSTAVASKRPVTIADLLRKLGDVPSSRVRFQPYPASENDVIAIQDHENRTFELIDGLLVEKAMGIRESFLAIALGSILHQFVRARKLGLVAGADGMVKLSIGLLRSPDVLFISWDRLPERKVPKEPIPNLAPNLAVEILSKSNTSAEMKRKRREYFKAGVSLVWIVDPKAHRCSLYESPQFQDADRSAHARRRRRATRLQTRTP